MIVLCANVLALHCSAWCHEAVQVAAWPLLAPVWYLACAQDPKLLVGESKAVATYANLLDVKGLTLVLSQESKAAEVIAELRP
mmetsp:Transcript_63358/g.125309  ORF Transcript_63358/g.125309 Transcript_63358/m.125309 type:complete len:83 (-) Transcript_63358:917-1165(-)